jgi:hypothetical protein
VERTDGAVRETAQPTREPTRPEPGSDSPGGVASQILGLQRAAGNAATISLLGGAGVIQREKTSTATAPAPTPDQGQVDQIAREVVDAWKTKAEADVLEYLLKGLGVGGTNIFRSSEVKEFRNQMKTSAREQAYTDVDATIAKDTEHGAATKQHVRNEARTIAYKDSKASVDDKLTGDAKRWAKTVMIQSQPTLDDVFRELQQSVAAALQGGSDSKRVSAAKKAATKQVKERLKPEVVVIHERAQKYKNDLVKPETDSAKQIAKDDRTRLEKQVKEKTHEQGVGEKSVEKAFKAATTDEGLGMVGKLLDQVVPNAGDQVALSVELQIPLGETPGFISIKLEGKAARGITGAMTSGVPVFGKPSRLEVMGKFSLGGGAEAFGIKGDLSVGFFVRAGADGTAATMKAMSYAAYRAACGVNGKLGDWWAGTGKASDKEAVERAEAWAAMVEEQVFGADDGAFADVGGSVGASGGLNAGVFEVGASVGGEAFRRYDQSGLKASLDKGGQQRFAQPVGQGAQAAKDRRKDAAGRTVGSFAISESVGVNILGQKTGFGISLSFEHSKGDNNDLASNWGVEITAGIGFAPGDMTEVAKIAVGIIGGLVSAVQSLVAVAKKNKVGSVADEVASGASMINAGLGNQITDALGSIWSVDGSKFDNALGDSTTAIEKASGLGTSGSLTVAVLFGMAGGKKVFRFEIRESKTLDVKFGIGNVGATVKAERGKRLMAVGYDNEKWRVEAAGARLRDPE